MAKKKSEIVIRFRNMMSLNNGSFHRVYPSGLVACYMNGDGMGPATKGVPKDCVETLTQQEANKHLPKCNRMSVADEQEMIAHYADWKG